MAKDSIPRREFLKGAGAAGAGTAVAALTTALPQPAQAQTTLPLPPQPNAPQTWLVLTQDEVAFLSAASDAIIPADELSPSGTDCGVVVFIDRQLASAWGGGAKMYRAGPFIKGTPEQGYQLPLTPHQFFVDGIAAATVWCQKTYGNTFDRLQQGQRNEALTAMEKGTAQFDGFDSKQFFAALLTINMEGFFADPIYGGNRNKASWRMLGFPGLPAIYADKVDEYRHKRYVVAEPQSIADFS
jgi:gluconate 2-dehydrogenase gamma chain